MTSSAPPWCAAARRSRSSSPADPPPPPPTPKDVRTAFEGPLFRVEVQRWADGRRRDVVRHPGACAAVTFVAGTDRVLLVRQVREAVGRSLLEIPAGVYDVRGESPEDAVRREIAEETGHRAIGEVIRLGRVLTTPGFTDEAVDLFEAQAEPGAGRPEEGIEVVPVGFERAVRMAIDGEIEDAKSALALLLADERRRRSEAVPPGGWPVC